MPDLKQQNKVDLLALLGLGVLPVSGSLALIYGQMPADWLSTQTATLSLLGIAPAVMLSVLLRLLADQVPARFKERLVHLRWSDPLPGGRAHKLVTKDFRLDPANLSPSVQPLLNKELSATERNAYWYQHIYKPVRDLDAIKNTHRSYLLYRDATAGVLVAGLLSIIADLFARGVYGDPILLPYAYVILVLYFALLIGAARNYGNRLVTGAISSFDEIEAAQGDHR